MPPVVLKLFAGQTKQLLYASPFREHNNVKHKGTNNAFYITM